jgi:fibronectin-binding autotransporter adhesin
MKTSSRQRRTSTRTVSCLPWRPIITALALLAAGLAWPDDGRAQPPDGLTCQKPLPPQGHVTSNPIACTVSCAKGETVASALALAPRTTAGLTITIKGTCIEAVDQVPGNVTLQGASSGDGVQAPAASTNPVLGISGAGVTLDNLTISGGVTALWVHSGATAIGTNLVIEGSSSRNVFANGIITLNSSTIEDSKADGIDVLSGGIVFLNGGTVRNNSRGISVGGGSYVDALGGAVISDNTGGHGVLVNGTLAVIAATIEGNSPDGVHLFNGGTAFIAGAGVVRSNGLDGVSVMGGSVEVDGAVSNNARHGIFVRNSGTAIIDDGGAVMSNAANGVLVEDGTVQVGSGGGGGGAAGVIQSNGANGIYLKTNSVGFFNDAGNRIVSNSGWGILCDGPPANPLIAIGPAGTIGTVSGNGAGQISCKTAP